MREMVDKFFDERLEKIFASEVEDERKRNFTLENIFGFSNEDLQHLFSHLPVQDKRVATVGSSGDQVLNAIDYGAKEVTFIDGNPYAIPAVELKLSAIKNLSYDEFMEYWTHDGLLNHKFYSKISHDLSEDTKMFWETLLLETGDAGKEVLERFSHAGSFRRTNKLDIKPFPIMAYGSEFYRDPKRYNELKAKMPQCKVECIHADLSQFGQVLHGKYDAILLSNIFDYVDKKEFCKIVKDLEQNCLAEGGKMQLHYDLIGSSNEAYNTFKKYLIGKKIREYSMIDIVYSTLQSKDSGLVNIYNKDVPNIDSRDMKEIAKFEEENDILLTETFVLEK